YSVGAAEQQLGLIPQNFSTGSSGGITYAQLEAIRSLAGVEVAAPLVMVGSVNWDLGSFTVDLSAPAAGLTAYRVTYTERIDAGLVTYGMDDHIALVAHDGSINFPPRGRTPTLTTGGRTIECAYPLFCWAPTLFESGQFPPYPDPPSDGVDFWPIWRVGQAAYERLGNGRLQPLSVAADSSIYAHPNFTLLGGSPDELRVPPESRSGWYRPVEASYYRGVSGDRRWQVVGTYEPACLPGFDALSRAGMETYAAPQVTLGDGTVLRPDRSVGGYIASPPLLLTNLAGAGWLMDGTRFQGQNSRAP